MKRIAIAIAGLALAQAGPSLAADTWAVAYGATIVATYSDGHAVKVFVEPDHSYSIVPASGETIRGTWADDGSQSCFTITSPAAYAGGAAVCLPSKAYQVGDSFQGQDATGSFTGVIQGGR